MKKDVILSLLYCKFFVWCFTLSSRCKCWQSCNLLFYKEKQFSNIDMFKAFLLIKIKVPILYSWTAFRENLIQSPNAKCVKNHTWNLYFPSKAVSLYWFIKSVLIIYLFFYLIGIWSQKVINHQYQKMKN